MDYLTIAANAARASVHASAPVDQRCALPIGHFGAHQLTASRFPTALLGECHARPVSAVVHESLTISADVMPHHYIARAVLLDLQPSQIVAALVAVEDAIREQHRHAVRTGWRACSDSLRIYFYAWAVGR
jgi:hypothetical protein